MKTSIKKITKLFGLLLLATVIIQGCSDVSDPYADSGIQSLNYDADALAQTCVAEESAHLETKYKSKNVGEVTYSIDEDFVYITYTPDDNWGVREIRLYITQDSNDYGSPIREESYDYGETDIIEFQIDLVDEIGLNSGDDLSELHILAVAEGGRLGGYGYYYGGGGGSYWGKKGKSKWGKKGSKWDKDDNGSKWGKKSNKWWDKDDNDHSWSKKSNKWGKKTKKWGKKSKKYCKKDHKEHCNKHKKKKKYCKKDEVAYAKISIKNFEECGGGGVIGGGAS